MLDVFSFFFFFFFFPVFLYIFSLLFFSFFFPFPVFWIQSLLFLQLQALFTLFSECFCIFPSRYLCTIGLLPSILALDGVYHLDSGCVPKQPYSEKKRKKNQGSIGFSLCFHKESTKKKLLFALLKNSKGEQKKR